MRNSLILLVVPLVAACGTAAQTRPASTGAPPPVQTARPIPPTSPAPPPSTASGSGFQAPRVMNLPGLEGVIGASAASLVRQFGTARLDVREGDVRKLQFSGQACVLDIYLYPLSRGAEPTATYIDARRASDGLDVDRASCVAALKR